MGGLFSKPKTPKLPPVVTMDTEAVKEVARMEAARMQQRRGIQGTILTGPGGVQGDPAVKKAVLGGVKNTLGYSLTTSTEVEKARGATVPVGMPKYITDFGALYKELEKARAGGAGGVGIGTLGAVSPIGI